MRSDLSAFSKAGEMSCGACGSGDKAISPKLQLDICSGEAMQSDGVAVRIPAPRERQLGLRNPRKLQDPKLPSEKEVEDHNLSVHMPCRSWCTFCLMGRGNAPT